MKKAAKKIVKKNKSSKPKIPLAPKATAKPVVSAAAKKPIADPEKTDAVEAAVKAEKAVIEQSITVKANAGEVWHALTDPDELENWWGEGVVLQAREGGKFQERWEDDEGVIQLATGNVKVVKDKRQITFTWREKGWPTQSFTECTFLIEPQGPGGSVSKITMRHAGWESLSTSIRDQLLKDFKIGWNYHMKELKAYLDE
jgi:uncharacterized protein YndB with AHSA1/START domain